MPKPFKDFGGNFIVKVHLSNYETKADIRNISHVNTSSFALETNLSDVVKNYFVKKDCLW